MEDEIIRHSHSFVSEVTLVAHIERHCCVFHYAPFSLCNVGRRSYDALMLLYFYSEKKKAQSQVFEDLKPAPPATGQSEDNDNSRYLEHLLDLTGPMRKSVAQ